MRLSFKITISNAGGFQNSLTAILKGPRTVTNVGNTTNTVTNTNAANTANNTNTTNTVTNTNTTTNTNTANKNTNLDLHNDITMRNQVVSNRIPRPMFVMEKYILMQ